MNRSGALRPVHPALGRAGLALVVHAHPDEASFSHALYQAALGALTRPGRTVAGLDLYREGFVAAMSRQERLVYDTGTLLDPQVAEAAELVKAARVLVFVYPTWWFGLPAILKGWLERVLVPGVGFTFDERTGKVRRGLTDLRRIVGVTTYGGSRAAKLLATDGGRRTLTRTLRLSAHPLVRTTWLGLHSLDTATAADRTAFVDRVARTLAAT